MRTVAFHTYRATILRLSAARRQLWSRTHLRREPLGFKTQALAFVLCVVLPVAPGQAQTASGRTKIDDIVAFLNRCPEKDPAYTQIRKDFVIRRDGKVVGDVACVEPYPSMSIAQLTNELITLQTLRVAYYMDPGVPGYLPWTSKSLYQWLASVVGGVDLKTQPGQLECCETIAGRKYIVQSLQTEDQREWSGIASTLGYFAHEARHAEGGPPHTNFKS